MKKLIIALFASFLFSPFAYSVSEPEIPIPTDPTGASKRKGGEKPGGSTRTQTLSSALG